jgi:hypothetical protein
MRVGLVNIGTGGFFGGHVKFKTSLTYPFGSV